MPIRLICGCLAQKEGSRWRILYPYCYQHHLGELSPPDRDEDEEDDRATA